MKRVYIFKWYKKENFGKPNERTTNILMNNCSGDTAVDAKKALQIFINQVGNLTKNEIISIKECDENGKQIGEDIKPMDQAIVPIARKKG